VTMIKEGDHVKVQNSLLYTGRSGTLMDNSGHPDDFWDWNVKLDGDGRIIGVTSDQVVRK